MRRRPCPGINTVLSTLAKLFIKEGYRVIGIHNAYKGLFSKDPEIIDFDFEIADRIFDKGGSVLYMASRTSRVRFNPDCLKSSQIWQA